MALSKIPADLITGGLSVDPAAPADAITVDSSGNVGVGTSSPSTKLHLETGSGDLITTMAGASRTWQLRNQADGNFGLYDSTAAAWRTFWDASGRVTMPYQPYFVAYRNTSVWETYSSQVVVWTSTQFNVGNHYSTSTGAFTAPVDGVYFFNAQIYTLDTLVYSNLYIRVNGASDNRLRFSYKQDNGAVDNTHHLTVVQKLNTNDTVDLLTNGNLHTGFSRFSGYLIG